MDKGSLMFDLVSMHQSDFEHTTHIGWAPSEFTYAVWEKVS